MKLKGIFIITQGTKKIVAITMSVSLLTIIFAYFYYRGINRSEDPRITRAKKFLAEYEGLDSGIKQIEAFHLLDSAFVIFNALPDYKHSFEKGIIYNNKCSGILLNAIYNAEINEDEKHRLLYRSMNFCDSSILIYRKWLNEWENLSPEEVAGRIRPFMNEDDPAYAGLNFRKIFDRRIKNIITAQYETPRRLSVSYANKGTVYRHLNEPDSALFYNRLALSLWEDNRTAESNLNVLLGGEPVKPKLIESLFPPDRKKRRNAVND
jgi:tetratricopeptide (TPR) repeat protein